MITVASPNLTAVDLVTRPRLAGGLSNVATILAELPDLDGSRLAELAARRSRSDARRLGWLLDLARDDLDLEPLHGFARPDDGQPTLLAVRGERVGNRDERWGVLINATVELDER